MKIAVKAMLKKIQNIHIFVYYRQYTHTHTHVYTFM